MGVEFQKAVCMTMASTIALAGCAAPKKLEAVPVPLTQYADLDCEQLSAEAQRLLARYVELGGKIDEDLKLERALEALSWPTVIVWPLAVLWLPFVPALTDRKKENEQRKGEFRQLMGERDAVLQVAAEKGCVGVALQPKTGGEVRPAPDAAK